MSTEVEEFKSIPHFDRSPVNWPLFYARIELYLQSKSLGQVIEKEIDLSPLSAKSNEVDFKAREKLILDDLKARSYIVNKLNADAFNLIRAEKSAYSILSKLKEHYQSESASSVLVRFDKLLDLRYDSSKSLISHVAEINSQILQLKDSGNFDWDKLHILILLRSMPKNQDWSSTITSLKVQEKELSKEKVIRILQDTETELNSKLQKGPPSEKKTSIAFNTNKIKSKDIECYRCGKKGHVKKDCHVNPKNFIKSANNVQRSKDAQKATGTAEDKSFSYVAHDKGVDITELWIKDSGASDHYCNNKSMFFEYKDNPDDKYVEVASGVRYKIQGSGSIRVKSFMPDIRDEKTVEIKNVYYVPEFQTNLISTIALQTKGLREVIKGNTTLFYDDKVPVLFAQIINKRYVMSFKVMKSTENAFSSVIKNNHILWHQRFNHLGFRSMEKLKNCIQNFHIKNSGDAKQKCMSCIENLMTRRPFKKSSNPRMEHPLDLIHMDFLVINQLGRGGETVSLVIVDDFSSCKFVFPLKSRSGNELWSVFKPWLVWAERSSGRTLKAIRTDNAKEFIEGIFSDKMEELGIECQRSVPYEHEQNGTAEITNRLIQERARTILNHAKLPKMFWPDAIICAAYVLNRSPVYHNNSKTPIELFTGIKPTIDHLRVFGCVAYARKPAEKLKGSHKLDTRAYPCIFIGYGKARDTYKFVSVDYKSSFEATNVLFEEEKFKKDLTLDLEPKTVDMDNYYHDESDENESEEEIEKDNEHDEDNDNSELRRSKRGNIPRREYWKIENRNPVYYAYFTSMLSADMPQVQVARKKEIEQLKEFKVWNLVKQEKGMKIIGTRFVDVQKKDENGNPGIYKSRLVAQGYSMIEGIDFMHSFAPIAKAYSVRIFFCFSVNNSLTIFQTDIKNAFVQAPIHELVYIKQPPGFEEYPFGRDVATVGQLNKALYGLPQSSMAWNKQFTKVLIQLNFKVSTFDPCIFTRGEMSDKNYIIICLIVDDFLNGVKEKLVYDNFIKELEIHFKVKDLGKVKRFIGMQVVQTEEKLILSQRPALLEILMNFNMMDAKIRNTPLEAHLKFRKTNDEETVTSKPYRSLIGCMMYPAQWTRPDLSFSVGFLSRYNTKPSDIHWNQSLDVLRYIKNSLDLSLVYTKDNSDLHYGHADAEFGSDLDECRFTYGYVTFWGKNILHWKSKRSGGVATSTTVAELESVYMCLTHMLWERDILSSLGVKLPNMIIYNDNMSLVKILNGEQYLERTKYVAVKIEFIREKIKAGILKVEHVKSNQSKADIFTKSQGRNLFDSGVQNLNLVDGVDFGFNNVGGV